MQFTFSISAINVEKAASPKLISDKSIGILISIFSDSGLDVTKRWLMMPLPEHHWAGTEGFGGGEGLFVLNGSWEFVISCKEQQASSSSASLSPKITSDSSATCWWFVHTHLRYIYRQRIVCCNWVLWVELGKSLVQQELHEPQNNCKVIKEKHNKGWFWA